MTDGWLYAVAFILLVFIPFDVYVAYRFVRVALERPHIPVLTLAALRSVAIAIAAIIAGVLGIQSIYFNLTGIRLLPNPVPAILIAAALIVISVPNIYALRTLRDSK